MRYLQITTTGICILLGFIVVELRALRPPTYEQLDEVRKSGNRELQARLVGKLPAVQVYSVLNEVDARIRNGVHVDSVSGPVAVRGTVAVDVENSVAVYNADKTLKVEVKE